MGEWGGEGCGRVAGYRWVHREQRDRWESGKERAVAGWLAIGGYIENRETGGRVGRRGLWLGGWLSVGKQRTERQVGEWGGEGCGRVAVWLAIGGYIDNRQVGAWEGEGCGCVAGYRWLHR